MWPCVFLVYCCFCFEHKKNKNTKKAQSDGTTFSTVFWPKVASKNPNPNPNPDPNTNPHPNRNTNPHPNSNPNLNPDPNPSLTPYPLPRTLFQASSLPIGFQDCQCPNICRSGIAHDGSGIAHVPIFVGPGSLMMAPGSPMSQYLQVRDCS
jgi:hypothetical protein